MVDGQTNLPNATPHRCSIDDLDIERPKADTVILKCTVCGRRRIEMVADPIRLKADIVKIG